MTPPPNLYAESSAVLTWLLGENGGDEVRQLLQTAQLVMTSDLTLIECDRALQRGQARGMLSVALVAQTRAQLAAVTEHWALFSIDHEVVDRARRGYPQEPLSAAAAIHLATALTARNLVTELGLVTLDDNIRGNAEHLGIDLLPHGVSLTSAARSPTLR